MPAVTLNEHWLTKPQLSSLQAIGPVTGQTAPSYAAISESKVTPPLQSVKVHTPEAGALQLYHTSRSAKPRPQPRPGCTPVVAPVVSKANVPVPLIGVAAEQSSLAGPALTTFIVNEPVEPTPPG